VEKTEAPGRLELIREFINTTEKGEYDEFDDPSAVVAWLEHAGVLDSPVAPTAAVRDAVVRVREALRTLAAANYGTTTDPRALDVVNEAARAADISLRFSSGGAEVRPLASGVPGAIGALLSIVAEAMSDGTWSRFKVCQNDECVWAFYDHARNRSGKWCDMAGCGNRMKARAYRARRSGANP
jgi:predicted RNA-binding Zn ribbon-like protein